ncbi:heparinase II/III family protein [Anaerosoma tenue]|uniref:heparinase II/III family protein n=1 Tax=Anaerosoma tenue TaxID=2933588 RepID=UPI002260C703|nr:heparinase II/III family protein [Anaerosoma tenue]MCK8114688.1 heparinase II/III family protein [Anaerosoma tenue]
MIPRPAYILHRLRELPLRVVCAKALKRLGAASRDSEQRRADANATTYAAKAPEGPLARLLVSVPSRVSGTEWLEPVCEEYMAHRFDVLGSGWTHVRHGMRCRGLEGVVFQQGAPLVAARSGSWLTGRVTAANLEESRRIWALVSEVHEPIDWYLDIKSGYRWDEGTWYRDIVAAPDRGADIKVPWELARCHHLPQMALLAAWSDAGERDDLAREFRDQVLDFIATNPPRFGVNWACAMDVGIRITNWLMAYELFRAAGMEFDDGFEDVFERSVLEHGRHVRGNLEGDDEFRGNHYLADLVGLLFCAAYLPRTGETGEWWAFASAAVLVEIEAQFHDEGTSFEASTGYHRLAAEMAVWAIALIVRIEGTEAVPSATVARLERMAEFVRDSAMACGCDPQIGDADSGRLLKMGVRYRWDTLGEAKARYENLRGMDGEPDSRYWLEEQRDHRHVIAAVAGLVARHDLAEREDRWVDRHLVVSLAGGRLDPVAERDVAGQVRIGDRADFDRAVQVCEDLGAGRRVVQRFSLGTEHASPFPSLCGYPAFGLYVFRGDRAYCAVRCGAVGQGGRGGHAHNDQLGIVLEVDGRLEASDPGSYVYTPLPERRNRYRSVHAHNAPRIAGREPASLDFDVFRLDDPAARCVYFGDQGFAGYHDGYGVRVWRLVEFDEGQVVVTDWAEDSGVELLPPDTQATPSFSPGYGWRESDERGAQ